MAPKTTKKPKTKPKKPTNHVSKKLKKVLAELTAEAQKLGEY